MFTDKRGSVAIASVFGILAAGAVFAVAVEFSNSNVRFNEIRQAADAAALAAVSTAIKGTQAGTTDIAQLLKLGKEDGSKIIQSALANINAISQSDVKIVYQNSQFRSTVTASAVVNRVIGSTWLPSGGNTVSVRADAIGALDATEKKRLTIAIDVSNSMAIGGNDSEVQRLRSEPGINCAFACHDPDRNHKGEPDRYPVALQKGYKLKIGFAKEAAVKLLQKMQQNGTASAYVYTVLGFGTKTEFSIVDSSDVNQAIAAVNRMQIEKALPQSQEYGETKIQSMMETLYSYSNQPKKDIKNDSLIIVTDGIQSYKYPDDNRDNRMTDAAYEAGCRRIREQYENVYTVYTKTPILNDGIYEERIMYPRHIGSISTTVENTLQRVCSSQNQKSFFLARQGEEIITALSNVQFKPAMPKIWLVK